MYYYAFSTQQTSGSKRSSREAEQRVKSRKLSPPSLLTHTWHWHSDTQPIYRIWSMRCMSITFAGPTRLKLITKMTLAQLIDTLIIAKICTLQRFEIWEQHVYVWFIGFLKALYSLNSENFEVTSEQKIRMRIGTFWYDGNRGCFSHCIRMPRVTTPPFI